MSSKLCRRCNIEKDASCFGLWNNTVDGLKSYCRECYAGIEKQRRIDYKEELNAKDRERYYASDKRKEQNRRSNKKCAKNRYSTEKRYKDQLNHMYGITQEEFDAMLEAQGGECANPACHNTTDLHLDHDHETGFNRGILCFGCNTAEGHFDGDIEKLIGIAEYLELHVQVY